MNGLYLPPVPLGGSFVGLVPVGAGVSTLVAAASNTKGLWLRWITFRNASNKAQIYADTAAPAGLDDTTKRCIASSDTLSDNRIPMPLLLPAGIGLFLYVSSAGPSAWVGYDLT